MYENPEQVEFNNVHFRHNGILISISCHHYDGDKSDREVAIVWPGRDVQIVGCHSTNDINHFLYLLKAAMHIIDKGCYPPREEIEEC